MIQSLFSLFLMDLLIGFRSRGVTMGWVGQEKVWRVGN